jgi:hypothetical protein
MVWIGGELAEIWRFWRKLVVAVAVEKWRVAVIAGVAVAGWQFADGSEMDRRSFGALNGVNWSSIG